MKVEMLDLKAQYKSLKGRINTAIQRVLDDQQFIQGPEVPLLEIALAHELNSLHAVGVSSGTDALLVSMMAAEIGHGDEVITTPYTFFSTAGSIARLGAKPVFVDIDPNTYNIDADKIENAITDRSVAVIPVHLFGQCCEMGRIIDMTDKTTLFVIEDAAQAIGAKYGNLHAGTMGEFGCLSFFPSKNLGAYGDAGMVLVQDNDLAEKIGRLRVHGGGQWIGGNFRMDTLQAAILLVKVSYTKKWIAKRRINAAKYLRGLGGLDIGLPILSDEGNVFHQYVIRVRDNQTRDELLTHMRKREIDCRVYYPTPLHLHQAFGYLGYRKGDFPVAEHAAMTTLAIPIHENLTDEQIDYVIESVKEGLE
jgi:dTDP-4-amino-4,6-dideoxygalactose transaminase|tara:strand:+ start:2730 stop:3821 length:1092 start_codon:yes stop_codon:yes gene_type:complete